MGLPARGESKLPEVNSLRVKAAAWVGLAVALVVLCRYDGVLSGILTSRDDFGEAAGLAGYWMGHGLVQGILLLVVLGIGYQAHLERWWSAAKQGLWAFAVSGLLVQVVKYLVGRPRPRLWAEGINHWGPTLDSGFNSFPSGHTATSMAVALVLAFHFPRLGPVFLAGAAFVAASRVLGGSHFPTDILGGMALGLAIGWAVVRFSNTALVQRPGR